MSHTNINITHIIFFSYDEVPDLVTDDSDSEYSVGGDYDANRISFSNFTSLWEYGPLNSVSYADDVLYIYSRDNNIADLLSRGMESISRGRSPLRNHK